MTAVGHRGYTNLSGDPMAADRLSRICKALAAAKWHETACGGI
jgi:hypothetical protein